jgi:hypothetical protein
MSPVTVSKESPCKLGGGLGISQNSTGKKESLLTAHLGHPNDSLPEINEINETKEDESSKAVAELSELKKQISDL